MNIRIKKLNPNAKLPTKSTEFAAAYDLYLPEDVIIYSGRQIIPLGFAMEIPNGYEAIIDPRSGFSSKGMEDITGVRRNADVKRGKIDPDYRDGVGVIVKSEENSFVLAAGTRIAQMTIYKTNDVDWIETDELTETNREGGFGSTGSK